MPTFALASGFGGPGVVGGRTDRTRYNACRIPENIRSCNGRIRLRRCLGRTGFGLGLAAGRTPAPRACPAPAGGSAAVARGCMRPTSPEGFLDHGLKIGQAPTESRRQSGRRPPSVWGVRPKPAHRRGEGRGAFLWHRRLAHMSHGRPGRRSQRRDPDVHRGGARASPKDPFGHSPATITPAPPGNRGDLRFHSAGSWGSVGGLPARAGRGYGTDPEETAG